MKSNQNDAKMLSNNIVELYESLKKCDFRISNDEFKAGKKIKDLCESVDNIIRAWEAPRPGRAKLDLSKDMLKQFIAGNDNIPLLKDDKKPESDNRYKGLSERLAQVCVIYGCKFLQEHGRSAKKEDQIAAVDLIKLGSLLFIDKRRDKTGEDIYITSITEMENIVRGTKLHEAVKGFLQQNREIKYTILNLLGKHFDGISALLKDSAQVESEIAREILVKANDYAEKEKITMDEKEFAERVKKEMSSFSSDMRLFIARPGSAESMVLLEQQRLALYVIMKVLQKDFSADALTNIFREGKCKLGEAQADLSQVGPEFFNALSKQTPTGSRIKDLWKRPSILEELQGKLKSYGIVLNPPLKPQAVADASVAAGAGAGAAAAAAAADAKQPKPK